MSDAHSINMDSLLTLAGAPATGRKRPSFISEEQWFWSKVDRKDDASCWPWVGALTAQGTPAYYFDGRRQRATRYALLLSGVEVSREENIIQTCRNLVCVNPAHLAVRTPELAFWMRVNKTEGCWFWTGGVYQTGYGQFVYTRHNHRLAHRYSWELANGPIPEGLCVLHRCDVNYPPGEIGYRRCVRPDHLFLGTDVDNVADMVAKGRQAVGTRHKSRTRPDSVLRGEANFFSELTERQVLEIRARYAAGGWTYKELAECFDSSIGNIAHIIHRRTWAHV